MTAQENTSSARALQAAAWWAMLTGLLEAGIHAAMQTSHPLMKLGPDYMWMVPAALLFVFLPIGIFFLIAGRVWRPLGKPDLPTFFYALVALLDLLILIPGFHHFAALALAAGGSTQVTRLVRKRAGQFGSLVRWTLPAMVGLTVVLAAGVHTNRALQETRTLSASPAPPPQAPNVLFVTLDAVRAANLSVYGYSRLTTPRLAALAENGVAFNNALSTASWTLPSHASMFTGHWYHEMSADYDKPLDDAYPTLAEFVSSRGYRAAGFVANLGYCGAHTGLARGFAHYEDYPLTLGQIASSSSLTRTILDNFRLRRLLANDEHLNRKNADMLNQDVLRWLDRKSDRPFFVFINYFDAHDPYLPPPPFDKKFGPGRKDGKHSPLHHWLYNPAVGHRPMDEATVREEIDAYDGAIAYMDDRLGALLDALQARGLRENTLVVVTADHGEEFGEHGIYEHSYSLYYPSVHVPLLISLPGKVPAARVESPVSVRQLPNTIVELLGLHSASPFPGDSLVPYWTSAPGSVAGQPVLAELNFAPNQPDWFPVSKGDMKSVTHQNMRYIRNGDGVEELYALSSDPGEKHNLAGEEKYRSTLEQLRSLIPEATGP